MNPQLKVQEELIRERDVALEKMRMCLDKYEKLRRQRAYMFARNQDMRKTISAYTLKELLAELWERFLKLFVRKS
jgi:hypothetical protein